jgi:hypothetical protein
MTRCCLFLALGALAFVEALPVTAQTRTCSGAYRVCVIENSPYGVTATDRCKLARRGAAQAKAYAFVQPAHVILRLGEKDKCC